MAEQSTIEFHSGNDVELNYTIVDLDNPVPGSPKDLTAAVAIVFAFAKKAGAVPIFTKVLAGGITVTAPPTAGKFKVTLVPADTEDIKGGITYYHEARVTDGAGKIVTVAYGELNLLANSITT